MRQTSLDQLRVQFSEVRNTQLSSVQLECFASVFFFFFFFFALLYGGCASAELLRLILNETSPTFNPASNPLIWKAHEVAAY